MLQIITEKFYKSGERYETLHRAVFYTNYRMLSRDERLETPVGVLLPTTGIDGLSALTCEILEKIEKFPHGDQPGVLISTGGVSLLNDFAAVTSFALNITCTLDPDTARRLLTTQRPSLGIQTVPSQLVRRTFDREIVSQPTDAADLSSFVTKLVGLERKQFEAAMRAIRQYIGGLHRIADDLSLAYTQLVMSIESLAQGFDGHIAEWEDYEHRKRLKIDEALENASQEVREKVKSAVLANEHVAAARRFRDFALSHLAASFFRHEATQANGPISRNDLALGLQEAYAMRSRYVHTLKEIPKQITIEHMPEMVEVGETPMISISGLARLARHIIMQFINRGRTIEVEEFDYRNSLPNIVSVRLAPQYWIANPEGFTAKKGPKTLTAFLEQFTSAALLRRKNAFVTDIRPILEVVEQITPGLASRHQRLPLLALYFLFHICANADQRSPQWPAFFDRYSSDFDEPSIEALVVFLVIKSQPPWKMDQFENLYKDYFKNRHRSDRTKIGRLLEAAFSLYVAELNRVEGHDFKAREFVSLAVEAHPSHERLRTFEASLSAEPLPSIEWHEILLPPPDAERDESKS